MKQPINSKSFCILPWIHINSSVGGRYRPCCNSEFYFDIDKNTSFDEAFKSKEMDNIRIQMANGIRPKECSVCYIKEDNGGLSYRQTYTYDKFKEFVGNNEESIKYLDIRFDNNCNLSCRMCDPASSNQIQKTISWCKSKGLALPNHLKAFSNNVSKINEAQRKENVLNILDKIEVLKVSGGEPFLSKNFLEIVNYMIDKGYSKNIGLIITTNGTKFTKKIISNFKYFKYIDINISVDGMGEVYDYIRYPYTWEKWVFRFETFLSFIEKENLYKNPKFKIRISAILMAYNWLNAPMLYNFLIQYNNKYKWLNDIHFNSNIDFNLDLRPLNSELSIKWLPSEILLLGIKLWKETSYRGINEIHNYVKNAIMIEEREKNKKLNELKYFTNLLDKQRNQKLINVNPELDEYLTKKVF